MNVIDRMWDAVKDTLFVSKEQFVRSLDGYALVPMINDGKMYGVVIQKGPSFHFMTLGEKWQLNRDILRRYPGSIIDEYGYAETFTPLEDTRQQRFNLRLGFVETHRDEKYVHYRVERMKCLHRQD